MTTRTQYERKKEDGVRLSLNDVFNPEKAGFYSMSASFEDLRLRCLREKPSHASFIHVIEHSTSNKVQKRYRMKRHT